MEVRLLEQMEKNDYFLRSNYSDLRAKYADEFVAIEGGKIIGASASIEKLKEDLRKSKINLAAIIIQFIPRKGLELLL